MMIIGLIGFGKVSQNIVKLCSSDEIKFLTSYENRSSKTVDKIKSYDISVLDTFRQVAENSDILISANSPASALSVAEEYGKYSKGIFMDLNNISPDTTYEISRNVDNFVDGAIIGKIDSDNSVLYVSGPNADDILFLNDFIQVKKISDKIGDAAILKMLRSTYTKTVSATLIDSLNLARKYNLEDDFFEMLMLTEGDDFKEKSISRVNNTLENSKRKSQELKEIINFFEEELVMVKAAFEKLNQ